jgi:hypothetical protein
VSAQGGADGETVFAGHHHIEQDEIGEGAGEDLASGGAAFSEQHAHALAPECVADHAKGSRRVIDDEEGRLGSGRHGRH